MRVNWFSPLPPQRTDIAHFTARIAQALMDRFEVEFWTDLDADAAGLPDGAVVRRFDPDLVYTREFSQAVLGAVNVFNLGNDSRFHTGIARVAEALPGFVVLHDTRLHHFTVERSRHDPEPFSSYLAAASSLYGPEGLAAAQAVVAANGAGVEDHVEAMPFTELYIRNALGVVCHSAAAAADIRSCSDTPLLEAPLPFRTLSGLGPTVRRTFKPPWRFVMFGYLNRNRRLESVLEALARWEGHDFRLDIFGSLWDEPLIRGLIQRLGLADRVHLHGFAPEADLDAAIAKAHLAFNLRHPTLGEASGGILRAWTFGVPAVVTDAGWYADLPEDAVLKVPADGEIPALLAVLDGIARDPQAYKRIGAAGLKRVQDVHAPDRYVAALAEAFAEAPLLARRLAARTMMMRQAEKYEGMTGGPVMVDRVAQTVVAAFGQPWVRAPRVVAPVFTRHVGDDFDWPGQCELTHWTYQRTLRESEFDLRRVPILRDLLVYDVSDLLIFVETHGFVSGIQRVQIELLAAALEGPGPDLGPFGALEFAFSEFKRPWRLPTEGLHELLAYVRSARIDLEAARGIVDRLRAAALAFLPGSGSVYFVPGAFWAADAAIGLGASVRRHGARFGVMIHDLFPVTLPGMAEPNTVKVFEQQFQRGLPDWDFFTTNSHYTAQELAAYLQTAAPDRDIPILPIPLAHGYDRSGETAPLPAGLVAGDFILSVGSIEPRKNQGPMIEAWRRLRKADGRAPKLVLAGRPGWRSEALVDMLREEQSADQGLVWLESVSDAELSALYRDCLFVVYPSVAEGWGLPVGEALSAGKVCVTSPLTSLPEVGGEFALYADPPDTEHLAAIFAKLVNQPKWRARLEQTIAKRFKPRTWNDVATDLLRALSGRPAEPPAAVPETLASSLETRLHHLFGPFPRRPKAPSGAERQPRSAKIISSRNATIT